MNQNEFRKYGIFIVGILTFAKFVLQPLNMQIKEKRETLSELEDTYKQKYKLYLKISNQRNKDKKNISPTIFYSKNQKDVEVQIDMLDRFTKLAQKNNLQLLNFEMPTSTEKEYGYKMIPLLIRLKGNPKDVVEFYKDLKKEEKIYKITDFSTSRLSEGFSFSITFVAIKVVK